MARHLMEKANRKSIPKQALSSDSKESISHKCRKRTWRNLSGLPSASYGG